MNVQDLLGMLNEAVAHGLNPSDEVKCWDPEREGPSPVTGMIHGGGDGIVELTTFVD